jgi:uncharacterized protein (DUF111 family)
MMKNLGSPMRIAYLECFSGISGGMFLGALLDAGVPFELFQKTVAGLNIGAELEHSRVHRGGLARDDKRKGMTNVVSKRQT